jgi:hypothetical protein
MYNRHKLQKLNAFANSAVPSFALSKFNFFIRFSSGRQDGILTQQKFNMVGWMFGGSGLFARWRKYREFGRLYCSSQNDGAARSQP